MSDNINDSANEAENIKREKTQAQEIEIRYVNDLIPYSPSEPLDNKQDFTPEKQEANFEFEEEKDMNEGELGNVEPVSVPALKISQSIAYIVGIDLEDPENEDQNISADPEGNEMYFDVMCP
jgi:hypothetical protein